MGSERSPGTISSQLLLPVLDALSSMGADTGAILAAARLDAGQLRDPGARLPADASTRLWAAALSERQDPMLGLRVAEHSRPGGAGAFEYMLRHSATLGEALARAERYVSVLDDRCGLSLRRVRDGAQLRIWRTGGAPFSAPDIERFFALCAGALRAEFPAHPPRRIDFPHPCGGDPAAYRRHFGCEVRFGRPHAELRFPAAALSLRPLHADPGLGAVLETHVEQLVAGLPTEAPLLQQARRALTLQLQDGSTSVRALCRTLHLSERTLRRRLAEHGYTFTSLLDELRGALVVSHLERPDLSLEQVAERLGFADVTTFHRWFKRTHGTTPGEYRRRHHGKPAAPA